MSNVITISPGTHVYRTILGAEDKEKRTTNVIGSFEITGGTVNLYGSHKDYADITSIASDMQLATNGSGLSGIVTFNTKLKTIGFVTASGTPTITAMGVVIEDGGNEL